MPREYRTAKAFLTALEDRLNKTAGAEKIQVNRLRRQVAFDRLLARLFRTDPAPWVLKGGYALELRFRTARATLDIDLTLETVAATAEDDVNQIVREMLQNAVSFRLGDWFEYSIGAPTLELDAAPYGGARYPVETWTDGRIFARFHLDAGIGDAVMRPVEMIECRDWLAFAGIATPRVPAISREQQFAEKLHAYTLPRSSTNSRVKDLIDLALLIRSGQFEPKRAADAVRLTFERRQAHELPSELLKPPAEWRGRFNALAEDCQLPPNMDALFAEVEVYFASIAGRKGWN
jgi:hypothetical protein